MMQTGSDSVDSDTPLQDSLAPGALKQLDPVAAPQASSPETDPADLFQGHETAVLAPANATVSDEAQPVRRRRGRPPGSRKASSAMVAPLTGASSAAAPNAS